MPIFSRMDLNILPLDRSPVSQAWPVALGTLQIGSSSAPHLGPEAGAFVQKASDTRCHFCKLVWSENARVHAWKSGCALQRAPPPVFVTDHNIWVQSRGRRSQSEFCGDSLGNVRGIGMPCVFRAETHLRHHRRQRAWGVLRLCAKNCAPKIVAA